MLKTRETETDINPGIRDAPSYEKREGIFMPSLWYRGDPDAISQPKQISVRFAGRGASSPR